MRDVFCGRIKEHWRMAVRIEHAYHMVFCRKRRNLRYVEWDIPGADRCDMRIKSQMPQKGCQQQSHAFAVSITLAQNLGWSIGTMSGIPFLVGYISYIALHPRKRVGNTLTFCLCHCDF